MVKLAAESNIDPSMYPITHQWDLLARKNYQLNQNEIDKQTYHIQRLQRYWLSFPYPLKQDSEIVTLNLLKKKQMVGEVQKNEVEIYEELNPCIRTHFARTFNVGSGLSTFGIISSASVFAFTSYCNFSIQARLMLTFLPFAFDLYRNSRNPWSEIKSSEFLDWVIGYRKAKSFAERYHNLFKSTEIKRIIGDGNIVELGEQLVNSVKI